ncbi:MAG: zinc ribbon domain-containing protein [Betaproteobacteria bacterium]
MPDDQSMPAACPACGLILAKFAAPRPRQSVTATKHTVDDGRLQKLCSQFRAAVRFVPPRIEPAPFWSRLVLWLLFVLWGLRLMWMDHQTGEIGSSFLHGPLLVFHEAGHVIFRLFGEFMAVLGGTLGQLLMPAVLCGALLFKNRDPFGAAICLWLVGVSLLDVAPYVYDALHPQLVLLGGRTGEEGGHDWMYLLEATGQTRRAHSLGWLVHKLGALVMVISMAWAGWILWQQRGRMDGRLPDTGN